MELSAHRQWLTDLTSISELLLDGKPFKRPLYILEDTDRGLHSSMRLSQIKAIKVAGRTAIPTGRYQILLTWSPKYQRIMPLLNEVPGYAGIRIHSGNFHQDTEGCLLPGLTKGKDYVGSSRDAIKILDALFTKAEFKKEEIFITITS